MNSEQIIPIGEYILIDPNFEQDSPSLLLNINNTKRNQGLVLAVGDKVNTDEASSKIEVNDIVIFTPGTGVKIDNSAESIELISIKNIIGKVKKGE